MGMSAGGGRESGWGGGSGDGEEGDGGGSRRERGMVMGMSAGDGGRWTGLGRRESGLRKRE